jgi:hypothetical protein
MGWKGARAIKVRVFTSIQNRHGMPRRAAQEVAVIVGMAQVFKAGD